MPKWSWLLVFFVVACASPPVESELLDHGDQWMYHPKGHGGPHFQLSRRGQQYRWSAATLDPLPGTNFDLGPNQYEILRREGLLDKAVKDPANYAVRETNEQAIKKYGVPTLKRLKKTQFKEILRPILAKVAAPLTILFIALDASDAEAGEIPGIVADNLAPVPPSLLVAAVDLLSNTLDAIIIETHGYNPYDDNNTLSGQPISAGVCSSQGGAYPVGDWWRRLNFATRSTGFFSSEAVPAHEMPGLCRDACVDWLRNEGHLPNNSEPSVNNPVCVAQCEQDCNACRFSTNGGYRSYQTFSGSRSEQAGPGQCMVIPRPRT